VVGRLVGFYSLTEVLFAVLEQAIDALGDFPGSGHHGLGTAEPGLEAPVKGAQGILGVMTALAG